MNQDETGLKRFVFECYDTLNLDLLTQESIFNFMKLMTKKQQQLSPTEPVLNESDMFLEIFYPDFVKISYALLEKEKRKDFLVDKKKK